MSKNKLIPLALAFIFPTIFLYKFFIFGLIPFPGDVLTVDYNPWKTYSYEGYNPASYPSKFQYFDVARQLYPWKTIVIEELKSGNIPLWNPYNFSGTPLLANSQSQVLFPLNAVFFALDQKTAWAIFLYLQYPIAFLSTYLLARRLKISMLASLFAATAYTFSLFHTVFFEYSNFIYTTAFLPLMLFTVESFFESNKYRFLLLFTLTIPVTLFAGHLQLFAITLTSALLYALIRLISQKQLYIPLLTSTVFGILLSLPQLLPTLELLNSAARAPHDLGYLKSALLIQPEQLILFFSPDFFGNPATNNYLLSDSYPGNALYIGAASTFLLALGLKNLFKNNAGKPLLAIALVTLLLTIKTPISDLIYSFEIPFLTSSAPNNALFTVVLVGCITAAFGLDTLKKHLQIKPILALLTIFAVFLTLSILVADSFNQKNLVLSLGLLITSLTLIFISKLKKIPYFLIAIGLISLTYLDLLFLFNKFNPFVPRSLVFPDAPILNQIKNENGQRFYGYKSASIEPNFATQYRLFDPQGYDPLYKKEYAEFFSLQNDTIAMEFDSTSRSNALISQDITNPNTQKLLNRLAVTQILDRAENASTEEIFPPEAYNLLHEKDGWKIYENTQALPFAFITTNYSIGTSNEEILEWFSSDNERTVLLAGKPSFESSNYFENAEIKQISPGRINISANASRSALLFLTQSYDSGWRANVNGDESKIFRANHAFTAIELKKGENDIIFTYKPKSFYRGLIISIITAGVLLAFIIYAWIYKRKKL